MTRKEAPVDFVDEVVEQRTEKNPAFPELVAKAEEARRLKVENDKRTPGMWEQGDCDGGEMTLTDWLYFLDTSSRVQCPEITAQQAAELAGLLRALTDPKDGIWAVRNERDALRAEVEKLRALDVALLKSERAALDAADRLAPVVPSYLDGGPPRFIASAERKVVQPAPDFDADDYAKPGKVKP